MKKHAKIVAAALRSLNELDVEKVHTKDVRHVMGVLWLCTKHRKDMENEQVQDIMSAALSFLRLSTITYTFIKLIHEMENDTITKKDLALYSNLSLKEMLEQRSKLANLIEMFPSVDRADKMS